MKKNAMDNWMKAFGNNLFDDSSKHTNQLNNAAVQPENIKTSSKTDALKEKGDN